MKRVLITGSSGFVGKHLSKYLSDRGYKVIGIDVTEWDLELEFHKCDITDKEALERRFSEDRPDYVVHLAALCNAKESNRNPYPTFMVNSFGTLNVLECCTKFGASLLLMSSAAVLGNSPERLPVTEENWKYDPQSGYAYSKVIAEYMVRHYIEHKGLRATIFRSWDLIGQGCVGTIVNLLADRAMRGERITLYCYGKQIMDVNYVGNLCQAVEAAIESEKSLGEMFHIGSGRPVDLKWIAEKLVDYAHSGSETKLAPPREGEVIVKSYPSIEKARRVLGYNPEVSVEEAIRRTVEG